MKEITVKLLNEDGLHGRAAANFVKEASKFQSDVKLVLDEVTVNGKSIIGIMSLGVFGGEEITLKTEGEDEEEAINTLKKLVTNKFED